MKFAKYQKFSSEKFKGQGEKFRHGILNWGKMMLDRAISGKVGA